MMVMVVVVFTVRWSNAAVSSGDDLSECRQIKLTADVMQ